MMKHLKACKERGFEQQPVSKKKLPGGYDLAITDRYNSDYWLIIEIREDAALEDLDQFIRDIWVECCGHLSCFTINGTVYESLPDKDSWWSEAENMEVRLNKILCMGMKFTYEYDFGSTTELIIQVIDHVEGYTEKDKVTILSRNHPMNILCGRCEKEKAVWFSAMEMYNGSGENAYLCDGCMTELENGDEEEAVEFGMYMPVCNSPRMGVCGYEGSNKFPEEFIPPCRDKEGRMQ
ncbi:MAG: hypothetical protein Q4D16_13000 [Eubacteriales bacterium]|nr:hypothetical protein [Eubacteriales bacterium]